MMMATATKGKPKQQKEPAKKKAPTKGETLAEVVQLLEQIEKAEKAVQSAEITLDTKKEEAKTAKGVWLTCVSELRELVRTREKWANEAKRQPLFNGQKRPAETASTKPADTPELPDGAKEAKTVKIIAGDIADANGKILAKNGQTITAYVDADGDLFLPSGNDRVILEPEEWEEVKPAATAGRPGDSDAYKAQPLSVLKAKLSAKAFDALEATHLKTLGDLTTKMNQHGQFWPKELGVHGRHKEAIEDAFSAFLMGK